MKKTHRTNAASNTTNISAPQSVRHAAHTCRASRSRTPANTRRPTADAAGSRVRRFHNDSAIVAASRAAARSLLPPWYLLWEAQIRANLHAPYPDMGKRGRLLPTAENLAELLRRIGASVRYNVIAKRIEIVPPNSPRAVIAADWQDELRAWCVRARMPTTLLDTNLAALAYADPHNPVVVWIESKPWDGKARILELCRTVVAYADECLSDGSSLKDALIRRWLISAVAAAYASRGFAADGVLTIAARSNLPISTWLEQLAPRELGVIATGASVNLRSDRSVKACLSKWIVGVQPSATNLRQAFGRAAFRAFVRRDRDEFRSHRLHRRDIWPRHTALVLSGIDGRIMRAGDDSRWWIVPAQSIRWNHCIDVQQVWAEALALYRAGEPWQLTPDEAAALARLTRRVMRSTRCASPRLDRQASRSSARHECQGRRLKHARASTRTDARRSPSKSKQAGPAMR